jgi:peroxiredoxin
MADETRQPLSPGTPAPTFNLPDGPDSTLSTRDLAGSPVVLVFYPADFSPVCSDELSIFNELLPEFDRLGAKVLGVSVDGVWCHRAFARERNLKFPLLADFQPKGQVSRSYRSYDDREGVSERALYVLDREGKIFWSYLSPIDVNPGADGVLDALERLSGQTSQPEASP